MLLIIVVLFLQITATIGSECSDAAESNNIPYIRMCEDGSVTSDKVIVDTHNAGATGETTCSCNVNATLIFHFYVQYYGNGLNPNISGCGSEVVVRDATANPDRSFSCNTFPVSFAYIKPMTITWSGGPDGDSKYCQNITACSKPSYPTTPTPSSATEATTTFTQADVTSYETTTYVDMNSPTKPQTTSTTEMPATSTETSAIRCSEEEGTICLSEPAFATIIVFLCLITFYATIGTILYQRRYLSQKKQHQNDNTNATTSNIPSEEGYVNMPVPPSSDRTYEGLELANVDLSTNTYEVLGNSGM